MNNSCLFCSSLSIKPFKLPKNVFNDKEFNYFRCESCLLVSINPIPSETDLEKMYPPSYQQGVSKELTDADQKLPGLRFSYKFLFTTLMNEGKHKTIVDFGCGNGRFIYNALQHDLKINGVEFSETQVKNLKNEIPQVLFQTVVEFFEDEMVYDIIFMSNVLEHFTNPRQEFSRLLKKLKPGGIVLIEGPLEMNTSLVNKFKWMYFKVRLALNKNYTTAHAPTHIFFSNHSNQLEFFKRHVLKTELFKVVENTWPYPESIRDARGIVEKVKAIIAKCSIVLCSLNKNWGNTFIYV